MLGEPKALLVNTPFESLGREGGGGHSATVGGVERTRGVAGDQEVLGDACLFVAATAVGRAAVTVDGRNGLGILYRLVDGGAREGAGILEERVASRRRGVAPEPH